MFELHFIIYGQNISRLSLKHRLYADVWEYIQMLKVLMYGTVQTLIPQIGKCTDFAQEWNRELIEPMMKVSNLK